MRLFKSAILVFILLVLQAPEAMSTFAQMEALPSYEKHGCLNCHSTEYASIEVVNENLPINRNEHLNSFGNAWYDNGQKWDAILALANSDGDGCTNGFELENPSGDWRPGNPRPVSASQQRNPGANDGECTLPVNAKNWGALKSLFSN